MPKSEEEREGEVRQKLIELGVPADQISGVIERVRGIVQSKHADLVAQGVHPHKATYDVISQLAKQVLPSTLLNQCSPGKNELAELGRQLWPFSYENALGDFDAVDRLFKYAESNVDPHRCLALSASLLNPSEQLQIIGSCLWYDQGLSQIVIGHRYAAALLATRASAVVADVRPPWRAFWIELPRGLLFATTLDGREEIPLIGVLVLYQNDRWSYLALTTSWVTLWRIGVADLFEDADGPEDPTTETSAIFDAFAIERTTLDERTQKLVQRLVANVCLAMSDPGNLKCLTKENAGGKSKRNSETPLLRTYQLGKTPTIDLRAAVREYVKTGRLGVLAVQVLVAGHWKRQAYGPGRIDRKVIWIEPYWRGPEDAPVLPRARSLRGEGDE